jgi:oleandomycin transport system permease protein
MTMTAEHTQLPSPGPGGARNAASAGFADADRVRFPTLFHAFALARRGVLKTLRTPEAFVDVTIQPVIFLVLFTYLFGGAVAGSQHTYLQYVLPGILVQSVMFAAVQIGVNLNTDASSGVADRFRSLPIARSAPLIGAELADLLRYTILTVVLLGAGFGFGFRIHTNPLAAIAACLLAIGFALCLGWVSVYIGMIARTPGAVQGILFLTMFPLTFGSNAYVSTGTLPGWLQAFVKVNPVTHLADAVRGLLVGGPVASHVLWTLVWSAGLLVVFFPLAVRAYRRKS